MEGWGAATPVSHRAPQRKQKVLLTWRGSCLESELVGLPALVPSRAAHRTGAWNLSPGTPPPPQPQFPQPPDVMGRGFWLSGAVVKVLGFTLRPGKTSPWLSLFPHQ